MFTGPRLTVQVINITLTLRVGAKPKAKTQTLNLEPRTFKSEKYP